MTWSDLKGAIARFIDFIDVFKEPEKPQLLQNVPRNATVRFDDEGVTCIHVNGTIETVRWADLQAVLVRTTADGPAFDDLFWMLIGRSSGCMVPSEAKGCNDLLSRLQELPDFDNKAVILACQCVDEQTFLCWERIDKTS